MKRLATTVLCAALAPSLILATQVYAQEKAAASTTNTLTKPTLASANHAAAPSAKKIVAATNTPASSLKPTLAATNSTSSSLEKTKIENIIHDYILANPEVVVEALQIMQRKQYEQAEQTIKNTQKTVSKFADALFKQSNDPIVGNPAGTVTITEFFDYQCGHCVEMAPVIESLKTDPNVRIVFKEFPIRGPISEYAARAALAANLQGKYYPLHHAMLTTKNPLTEDSILTMAKEQGLDVEKLKTDMNSKTVEDQLKNNMKLAQELKLFGTPAFFIGKSDGKGMIEYVPGQMNETQMKSAIEKVSK